MDIDFEVFKNSILSIGMFSVRKYRFLLDPQNYTQPDIIQSVFLYHKDANAFSQPD